MGNFRRCTGAEIRCDLVAIYCNFEPLKREDEYGPWVMNQEFSREYDTHRLVGGEGNAYVTFFDNAIKTLSRSKLSY